MGQIDIGIDDLTGLVNGHPSVEQPDQAAVYAVQRLVFHRVKRLVQKRLKVLGRGKHIYQISIKDINGDIEIPKQGIMYITANIDKGFIP